MNQLFSLKIAIEFYESSSQLKMPAHLKDQFVRACSSIALNLSEGSAKPTVADRRKFYFTALGSLRECQTILKLASASDDVLKQADFLGVCVYKLCRSVR